MIIDSSRDRRLLSGLDYQDRLPVLAAPEGQAQVDGVSRARGRSSAKHTDVRLKSSHCLLSYRLEKLTKKQGFKILLLFVFTQACSEFGSFPDGSDLTHNGAWIVMPDIAIVASEGDPRLESVYEAVDFWNNTFIDIGSPFRFGSISQMQKDVDIEELMRISSTVLKGRYQHELPESVEVVPEDIILVLSEGRFVSFVAQSKISGKVLIGIRCYDDPLTLPNVTRNLIAHELGHAIGLGHNRDPTKLMCGRPASCRPDDFQSDEPRFFPLTEEEVEKLLEMYPGDWVSQR